MSNIEQSTQDIARIIRAEGRKKEMPQGLEDVYTHSEMRVLYTPEGVFEALFFQALGGEFVVTKDYSLFLLTNDGDEEGYRSLVEELEYELEKFLSWRADVLAKHSI